MTYRMEANRDERNKRVVFHGLLDQAALDAVRDAVKAARESGADALVLALAAGSTVDAECIAALRTLEGLRVEADSPFLAHWLRQGGLG